MRGEAKLLYQLLKPVVESLGYELLGIEHLSQRQGSLLRVYIDTESGITLNDCERVSHQISGVLDAEDPVRGSYLLEVSSPGLDRPLFTLEHFKRFVGSIIKLELVQPIADRKRLTGKLVGVEADSVIVIDNAKEYCIPFNMIGQARLVP